MKLTAVVVGACALLASTIAAIASEDTGTIVRIEWSLGTITLDNSHTYIVPPAVQASVPVRLGDAVKVIYEDKIATAITKLADNASGPA